MSFGGTKLDLTKLEIGQKVWLADDDEGWLSGELVEKGTELSFKTNSVYEDRKIVKLNPQYVEEKKYPQPQNPEEFSAVVDDLTTLLYLNEPTVMDTIRRRYAQKKIYTYSGIVLVAMNPYARLDLYRYENIKKYSGKKFGTEEPHLYAIAEEAYKNMSQFDNPQSIFISGESGAGKTVSAKHIMTYFASVEGTEEQMSEIEAQVLASNPITEALGNAKTTRNDNSSRFGKYIEIQFGKNNRIMGALIRTYLLERSRVVVQASAERNYHIFYQVVTGLPAELKEELKLTGGPGYFHYLSQGVSTIDGVDDGADLKAFEKSMDAMKISKEIQLKLFRLLAGILHIGNIKITMNKGQSHISDIDPNDTGLVDACKFLEVDSKALKQSIITQKVSLAGGKGDMIKNFDPDQAGYARDAISKFIYSKIFDWMINKINDCLCTNKIEDMKSTIGVLDIYGFESFKVNSFEQFCINYANEKLQQEFMKHVFKLEQEEYVREKIQWSFIPYNDNQQCIELIEGKPGILAYLDEESRLPKGTDQGFAAKIFEQFKRHSYFKKSKFSETVFTVHHYALDVTYDITGFLDKNKDNVYLEQLVTLQGTSDDFFRELFLFIPETERTLSNPNSLDVPGGRKRGATSGPDALSPRGRTTTGSTTTTTTIAANYKQSLSQLMDRITSSTPHYVRCIKPNMVQKAFVFEPLQVLSQLRACGVLETIKISAVGYPSRWQFDQFVKRYSLLVPMEKWVKGDNRATSKAILDIILNNPDKYQVGETKIFLRVGVLAQIEDLRNVKLHECATKIQKHWKRFKWRKIYLKKRKQIIMIQSLVRRRQAMNELVFRRKTRAAIILQTAFRKFKALKHYKNLKKAAILAQKIWKGIRARRLYQKMRELKASLLFQRYFRMWKERKQFLKNMKSIVLVQCQWRRRKAKGKLIALRLEAKNVGHLQDLVKTLEEQLKAAREENEAQKQNQAAAQELETLKKEAQEIKSTYESELEALRAQNLKLKDDLDLWEKKCSDRERDISELKAELMNEVNENTSLKQQLEESTLAQKLQEQQLLAIQQQLQQQQQHQQQEQHQITTTSSTINEEIEKIKRQHAAEIEELRQQISTTPSIPSVQSSSPSTDHHSYDEIIKKMKLEHATEISRLNNLLSQQNSNSKALPINSINPSPNNQEIQSQIENLSKSLTQKDQEILLLQDSFNKRLESKEADIQRLSSALTEIQNSLSSSPEGDSSLSTENALLKIQIQELSLKYSTSQDALQSLSEENQKLKVNTERARIQSLQTEIKTQREDNKKIDDILVLIEVLQKYVEEIIED